MALKGIEFLSWAVLMPFGKSSLPCQFFHKIIKSNIASQVYWPAR